LRVTSPSTIHCELRDCTEQNTPGRPPRKLMAACWMNEPDRAGMTPIICVGETLEERELGTTDDKVRGQIEAAFQRLPADDAARCIVAYEPIWAIGTGRNATPDDANNTIGVIREHVRVGLGDDLADGLRILYGGSVKPDNIDTLMAEPDIDGALVGGASLVAEQFIRIVQFEEQ